MNEAELMAQALAEMRKATISVDEWCSRIQHGWGGKPYQYTETHNYAAQKAMEQAAKTTPPPPPPPPPTGLSLQRTIFWANVTDDAVQHACRLVGWRHALTADPAYAPTVAQVNALKAASAGVDAWGNQIEIGKDRIAMFLVTWNLGRAIHQAETEAEALTVSVPYVIGNPNAWDPAQRNNATVKINAGNLAVTAECYDGRPDTYSAQGVPVSSLTLGVAMDAGVHYPLADLLAKTPVGLRSTVCVWHGAGLTPADWAALGSL